jgi:hypothetical protein
LTDKTVSTWLLRISRSTLLALCELAEHPAARPANPRALDSFLVGCYHHIAHASLVVWLERNPFRATWLQQSETHREPNDLL